MKQFLIELWDCNELKSKNKNCNKFKWTQFLSQQMILIHVSADIWSRFAYEHFLCFWFPFVYCSSNETEYIDFVYWKMIFFLCFKETLSSATLWQYNVPLTFLYILIHVFYSISFLSALWFILETKFIMSRFPQMNP